MRGPLKVFAVLMLVGGCGPAVDPLPPKTTAILRNPQSAILYRTRGQYEHGVPVRHDGKRIDDYPILAEKSLQPETQREIGEILTNADFYGDSSTDCILEPGWAVSFQRESVEVTVLICYKCGDVEFVMPESLGEREWRKGMGSNRLTKRLYELLSKVLPQPA